MQGFYYLFPTLLIILVSILVIRAAAIWLMMTGLDEKKAKFQAISAFTGTGFSTREAETVMNNPARRSIVSWLMILGNVGIASIIITATSSFIKSHGYQISVNAAILFGGIYLIYILATKKGLIRRWEDFVQDRLIKSGALEEGATEDLLHLIEGYGLVRAAIKEGSQLAGKTLEEIKLRRKKLLVFGIERGKKWISIPSPGEVIKAGDKLVVYGPLDVLRTELKN